MFAGQAINGAERHFRPFTSWFDGIDMHHRCIEGFHFDDSSEWTCNLPLASWWHVQQP